MGWLSAERAINYGSRGPVDTGDAVLEGHGQSSVELDELRYGEPCDCEGCEAFRAERRGAQLAPEPAAAKRPRRRSTSREEAVKLSPAEIQQLRDQLRGR